MTPSSTPSIVSHVIIVAEDEPLIRMMITEVLEDDGFTVVEVNHAAEALAILEARADEIHILFTDIHMPGLMDGLALAHHTRRHWPWISLLVTSGRARPHTREMPEGGRFIAKPYQPETVMKHVRELVGAA